MNIKDKLARLEKKESDRIQPESSYGVAEKWIDEFQQELNAKILSEGGSFIILKENYYPLFSFESYDKIKNDGYIIHNFHYLTNQLASRNFDLKRTLFIDLETTGLSGGTGTFAFLIGVGHLEADHIVVRQYLVPDFQHEWLMLKLVENNLLSFNNILSYNGKSFDIPLLRNRFVLNRMESVLDELLHVDLLHASRRLWKRRLTACDLQNLEFAILGQERLDDIPGELIPQIYFEFIRKRNARQLIQVLEHNFYDIVNMIILSLKIGQIIENPLQELVHPDDLFSLGKYYFQTKKFKQATPIFEKLYFDYPDSLVGKESIFLLSLIYKKLSDFKKSSQLNQILLEKEKNHSQALEELAKYYEHKEKNFEAALDLVEQGIQYIMIMEQLGKNSPLVEMKENLRYRQQRLKGKLKRQGEKC